MSHVENFMEKATQFLEANSGSFYLKKPVPGWSFTTDEKKTIPKGEYVIVEPDDRDKRRMVISQKKSYHMYSILRQDIPYHDKYHR